MNPWIAIVGTRSEGRPELVAELIAELRARGVRVGGFVQEPVIEEGETLGYDVVEVAGEGRLALARVSDAPLICEWGFSSEGFEAARRWALDSRHELVIVEVGRLESAERGHWATLLSALREGRRTVVVVIRPHVLASVALKLPDPVDSLEMPAARADRLGLVERITAGYACLREGHHGAA